jgi:predicted transcriptional regulator
MPVTAKSEILRVLAAASQPLAVHEISPSITGYSENALATRLSELHADGKVVRRKRPGEAFNEWRLATHEETQRILATRVQPMEPQKIGRVLSVQTNLDQFKVQALIEFSAESWDKVKKRLSMGALA